MKNRIIPGVVLIAISLLASIAQAQSGGALGVTMSDNTRGGVLIMSVLPGSPAAGIGLKSGDRIMSIGGKKVANYRDVIRLVAANQPKARVDMVVDRGGWTRTMSVTLGAMNKVLTARPVAPPPIQAAPGSLVAPQFLQDLTPADIDDQHGFGG